MWREKLTNFSDRIFPGLHVYNSSYSDKFLRTGTEILSNLPLQVTIYFNIVFFPCWLVVTLFMLPLKFSHLTSLVQTILILSIVSVIIIEVIRLYLGYVGNLDEQIPELAGFWLISILLQTPLQSFLLLCPYLIPSHIEIIVQTIMCLFLYSQLMCGFFALRHASKHSVEVYHMANFNFEY